MAQCTVIAGILGVPPGQRKLVLELGRRAAPSLGFGLGWRQYREILADLRGFGEWLGTRVE